MATDHRGRPTGDNHRSYPRVQAMLVRQMNSLGSGFHAVPEEHREATAKNIIDQHVADRGGFSKNTSMGGLIDKAFKNRHSEPTSAKDAAVADYIDYAQNYR